MRERGIKKEKGGKGSAEMGETERQRNGGKDDDTLLN